MLRLGPRPWKMSRPALILPKMTRIVVALLFGAASSLWAGADSAAPAPTTPPPPDQTAPAAPPPSDKKPDDGKPAITKEEFASVFGTGYDAYAALKGEQLRGFEARFKGYQTDRANPVNVVWFRSWDAQFTGKEPRIDLSKGQQAAADAERAAGRCASEVTNDPACNKPVPRQPDPSRKPSIGDVTGTANENSGSTQPPTPVPDVKAEKPAEPAVDKAMKDLIRNAAFGGIAGAVVGIGLLPLLGPIGILLGAMLGAAVMVVGKKLAG